MIEFMGHLDAAEQPTGELFRYRYLVVLRSPAGPVGADTVDALGPDVVGVFTTHTVS